MTEWLHPLHKYIFDENLYYITKENVINLNRRRIGKSTITALRIIAKCLENPEIYFKVLDHHGTIESHRAFKALIEEMISKLDLKGFEFQKVDEYFLVRFK